MDAHEHRVLAGCGRSKHALRLFQALGVFGGESVISLVIMPQRATKREVLWLIDRQGKLGERRKIDLLQHAPVGADVHAAGVHLLWW